ncbi:WG repeat-containing protein [Massilimicrobiota sp. SW1139]|uniref:WG repeat-containing protein n=1 Tax=Massilimicrobiota sp. SW1139 TaxID=2530043 RepID=UPI00143CB578|nr:WG repeat-containing protein [Massilimicrobiota sp. SW1139]NJE44741.1 hypothetical protein [Massilimicrobiota sp. SW1139]
MKKIFVGLITLLLLVGCSQNQKLNYFMLTNDKELGALYNSEGEQITEYQYQSFERVGNLGYIVTNSQKQVGLISLEGDEMIPMGEYETLESVDQMFFATKKVEKKKDDQKQDDQKQEETSQNQLVKDNLYVLNSEGEILYQANDKTSIMKTDLPVIYQDKEYIVLYQNGEELYRGKDAVTYVSQYQNGKSMVVGFKDKNHFYYVTGNEDEDFDLEVEKGTYTFLLQNDAGCIINDEKLKSMIYIDFQNQKVYQNNIAIKDAYFDNKDNIILTSDDKTYLYSIGGVPTLINTYYYDTQTYLIREEKVYGPHYIYKDGKSKGTLENSQLYPNVQELNFEMYPVYVQEKGYVYYNFDNKQVFDQTYLEANPFDACGRAIVKIDDQGYSLIDDKGEKLTEKAYYRMEYIGSSYYAVYNENGMYGIIDITGEEVFPVEYTSLPETPLIEYNDENYLLLNKNGRSYVYSIDDDMEELFSIEGDLTFHNEGYFSDGYHYYTIEGESIE